jgi:allantoinase
MPLPDLIIRGRRVVLPDAVTPATILINDGRIAALGSYDEVSPDGALIEAGNESIVMPGLVDTHVHVNEPGRTEWEGFATATRAAAAGGVTTIIDMPLNSIPPTTTITGLEEKLAAARDQCYVDVGFWGGVVPGNTPELEGLARAGVVGFKCFLIPSGVDEFPNVTEDDLREAMPELKRLGAVLIVHAEVPGPIERMGIPTCQTAASDREICATEYQTFLNSRPRAAENEAVELMIRLSREFGTRVHIVHHSSADALPTLREAITAGVQVTAETCPHYLFFAAEEIRDRATEFKCCPPIRERENREQLWEALRDGTIQLVVSDHSPCPPELKLPDTGNFLEAWGGIASLQFRLPVVWTEARKRGHSIEDLASWLCAAPAKLVNLDERKGRIAVGCDADLTIWNPDREFVVEPGMIHHRHKETPYAGQKLLGAVEKSFLRGRKIYDDGEFTSEPEGRMLLT